MSTADDLFAATGTPAKTEIRRNQYGHYLVVPPEGGKPVGYTRATTVAKALDEETNLKRWHARMTALGLARRQDLLARVTAADPDDKRTIDTIVDAAVEAGGGTERRDLGTALHSMFERSVDDPTANAGPWANDIAAIHHTLNAAGLVVIPEHREMVVVLDRHRVAGTADTVLHSPATGRYYVADLKTGAATSIRYSHIAWAIQLGIYAGADNIYQQGPNTDGSADVRLPMPALDQTIGLVLHVEPGSGRCDIHKVDIAEGARLLELAMVVRTERAAARSKASTLLVPLIEGTPSVPHQPPAAVTTPPVMATPTPPAGGTQADGAAAHQGSSPAAAPTEPPAEVLDPEPGYTSGDPTLDERRRWIRARVWHILNTTNGTPLLTAAWPAGVPTLRDELRPSPQVIDLIAEACDTVERQLGDAIAFPPEDPAVTAERERLAEHDRKVTANKRHLAAVPDEPAKLSEDHPDVAAVIARLAALDVADQMALTERAQAAGIGNLRRGVTVLELVTVDTWIDEATAARTGHIQAVADFVAETIKSYGDDEPITVMHNALGRGPDDWSTDDLALARIITAELGRSLSVSYTAEGTVELYVDRGEAEELIDAYGGKRPLLAAAKYLAGDTPPKSTDEALARPGLVALLAAATPAGHDHQEQ